jgi:hypothetical protein
MNGADTGSLATQGSADMHQAGIVDSTKPIWELSILAGVTPSLVRECISPRQGMSSDVRPTRHRFCIGIRHVIVPEGRQPP